MQLLSILALFALTQGTFARSLCKVGQRYCGSAFKQFDNAGMTADHIAQRGSYQLTSYARRIQAQ